MKTVLFDVDTQLDFLYPAGALAVPEGAELTPILGELTRFAAAHKLQTISTVDAHSEDDPEFKDWPPHCVVGSTGQTKSTVTLRPDAVTLQNVEARAEQLREVAVAPQIVLQKQSIDAFTNVNLRNLLEAIGADRYLVYGVAAEICVAKVLFGLVQTGKRVELVTDATRAISEEDYRNKLAHFQAAGGMLTTAGHVMAVSRPT